jgi:hypothetical protein
VTCKCAPFHNYLLGKIFVIACSFLTYTAFRSLSSSPRGSSVPSSQPSPGRPTPVSIVLELEPPPSTTDYCDTRLLLLEISNWTRAPISNALAASLISLYLKIDHPTLGLFDGDLFLDDLILNQGRYCSPLLVTSILVWACVSFSGRTGS